MPVKTVGQHLAEKYNIDFSKVEFLEADPQMVRLRHLLESPHSTEHDPKPLEEAAHVLILLERGHTFAKDVIGKAINSITRAIRTGLRLPTISPDKVPRRPTIEGLTPSLRSFAKAKREYPHKLSSVSINPDMLEHLADQIDRQRAVLEPIAMVADQLHTGVSVSETEAVTLLRDHYELVRPIAKADPDLWPILKEVDSYLYGAAEKAKITRKDNDREREELTAEAEKRGLAQAESKAFDRMSSLVGSLVDRFKSDGNPPPDDRNRPR